MENRSLSLPQVFLQIERKNKIFTLLFASLFLITGGCQSSTEGENNQILIPVEGSNTDTEETDTPSKVTSWSNSSASVASGTGRYRGASRFPSERNSVHFLIEGQFFDKQSEIVFHLFHESFENDNGLQIILHPEFEKNEILFSYAEANRPSFELTHLEESLQKDGRFSFRFEMIRSVAANHRILIWNNWIFFNDTGRSIRERIIPGNADYDSARRRTIFRRTGGGLGWGVSLVKSQITELKREAPYVPL